VTAPARDGPDAPLPSATLTSPSANACTRSQWARGYQERFGIVHVDFNDANRTRTVKDSAHWLAAHFFRVSA
jgi:hypothetical protein